MKLFNNLEKIKTIENENELEKMKSQLLSRLGQNVIFENDIWVCDKLKDSPSKSSKLYTLYFKAIPYRYKKIVKYFALIEENVKIGSLINEVSMLKRFLYFLEYYCNAIELKNVDKRIINNFEIYLNKSNLSKQTKRATWYSIYKFFNSLYGFEDMPKNIPINRIGPWTMTKKDLKVDKRYIPKYVIDQLDELFKNESLPLYYRVIYWLMRSIPSRASEISGMKIDCIKAYMDNYIIIIPSWKQNGGYLQPQLRHIYVKNSGHGKFLIDLIKEQQSVSRNLQSGINDEDKGMLFTVNVAIYKKDTDSRYVYYSNPKVLKSDRITAFLKLCCKRYNIKDEHGEIYNIGSHQFRHNGITDRLYYGFSMIEIRDMTAHQGESMIINSYKHIIPEKNKELQSKIINNNDIKNKVTTPVYFRGRVLNLDDNTEKRLLQNPRAYKISDGKDEVGICTDITGCKGNVFECLGCEKFAPKVEQLDFYENQVKIWTRKCILFSNQVAARENAEYNLSLYKAILEKIKITLEKKYEV